MNKIINGFLMLCVAMLFSCSDEEQPKGKAKLNIEGAQSIVVYDGVPSNSGGRVSTTGTNLYKVMLDGSVEQVKFTKEDNTEIDPNVTQTSITVSNVYDVNDNFLILEGSFTAWDISGNTIVYSNLLVRKDDGAIFDFRDANISASSSSFGENLFHQDANGNFYYVNNQLQVVKVNVSDPSNISTTSYLPTGQSTVYFSVDNQGNCVYENSSTSLKRIKKKTGGIHEFVQTETGLIGEFWIGTNGNIYFISINQQKHVPTINKVTIHENGDVSYEEVWEAPTFGTFMGVSNLNHNYYFKIQKPNSVVFIAFSNGSNFEFFEDDNNVLEFDLPEGTAIVYSKNYYYLKAEGKLFRVSLEDHSYENILPAGQYETYTMLVDDNDVLQMSALRFSDGKKIIAEINLQNEFKVVEEEKDQDVLYLQRLN